MTTGGTPEELEHRVPWEPPSLATAADTVCHYTDAAGLLGILERQELWATEASGMNDTSEVTYGWTVVRDWLGAQPPSAVMERLTDTLFVGAGPDPTKASEAFLVSASAQVDDANQWRLYGDGGRGYAIELDPTVPLHVVSPLNPVGAYGAGPLRLGQLMDIATVLSWSDVRYGATAGDGLMQSAQAWAEALLDALDEEAMNEADFAEDADGTRHLLNRPTWLINDSLETALTAIAHTIKTEGFSGEREARLVVRFGSDDRHVGFRAGRHGVVRFVRLGVPPADGKVSGGGLLQVPERPEVGEDIGRLPIRTVWIGPGLSAHLAKPTVRSLLRRSGFPDDAVAIKGSQVTLR